MAFNNSVDVVTTLSSTQTRITINPAAQDSWTQFNINAVSKFRIGTLNSGGNFKLSKGSAFGTTDTYSMNSSGQINIPETCSYLYSIGSQSSVWGFHTNNYVIGTSASLTKIIDQNSNMTTSGVFTAPVTGMYVFGIIINVTVVSTGGNIINNFLADTSGSFQVLNDPSINAVANYFGSVAGSIGWSGTTIQSMTAGDTASWKILGNYSATGTNNNSINSGYIFGALIS